MAKKVIVYLIGQKGVLLYKIVFLYTCRRWHAGMDKKQMRNSICSQISALDCVLSQIYPLFGCLDIRL